MKGKHLVVVHQEAFDVYGGILMTRCMVYLDGGGERKGIVGMVGIEGIVVGIDGNGAVGNGGSVTFGAAGNVGLGRDGIWVLGD